MRRVLVLAATVAAAMVAIVAPALGTVTKGALFYNGGIVRTVVTPVAQPGSGTDPFYVVTNGAAGQKGIAGVAPGDAGYHGGHWAVHLVTFGAGVTPYLLTSQAAVQTAETAGNVIVVRDTSKDFLCPVQP